MFKPGEILKVTHVIDLVAAATSWTKKSENETKLKPLSPWNKVSFPSQLQQSVW